RETCGHDRGHAGSGRDAVLRPLERGQPLLEHPDGRIGEARIDVAFVRTREALGRLGRVLKNEARRQEYRLAVFVERRTQRSGAYRARVEIEIIRNWI